MDRAEVIETLKGVLKIHKNFKTTPQAAVLGKWYQDFIDKIIEALQFAIHSLEVDEKYGLLYMETTHKEATDDHQEGEL